MTQGYAQQTIRKFNIIFYFVLILIWICLFGCSTTQPNKKSRLEQQRSELEAAGFKTGYIK